MCPCTKHTNSCSHICLFCQLDIHVNMNYTLTIPSGKTAAGNKKERGKAMARKKVKSPKKKSGNQDKTVKIIILITAILNLIKALIDLIRYLTG